MLTKTTVRVMVLGIGLLSSACKKAPEADQPFAGIGARPDVLPVMLNKELPFRYPASLYAKKVQANVTLRVFIDKEGQVVSESTHVAETSGIPPLDSAAVKGSGELRFIPAKTRGEPVPVSILFPVYFRHPEARPLPGDTILKKTGATAILHAPAAPSDTAKLKTSTKTSASKKTPAKASASKKTPARASAKRKR